MMNKVNEHQAMQMLAGALGVQVVGDSFNDFAREFDRTHPNFPFALGSCRVVYERTEMITEVLFSRGRSKAFLQYFDEVEAGTGLIFFDARLPGKDGAMLAFEAVDLGDLAGIVKRNGSAQKKIWFFCGDVSGRLIIVFRLREFIS
jgi:hypothetical protein